MEADALQTRSGYVMSSRDWAGAGQAQVEPGPLSHRLCRQNQSADTVGDIVLIADLCDSEEKYQSVFDTAPSYERGYLPINVIVFNNSAEGVTVNPAYISCLATTGTPHALVPAEDVLRSTVGRFAAGG